MVQVPNAAEDKFEFYFFILQPLEVDESVVIFDELHFPADWTKEEMEYLGNLKINVQAFGAQTFELQSCFEAMTKAFPDHFNFN